MNGKESEKRKVRWRLYEAVGTTLFTERRLKLFSQGLSPFSLEDLLYFQRVISLLTTPLACVIVEKGSRSELPDYLTAIELLRGLILSRLRPLQDCPDDSPAALVHTDFINWLAGWQLRGRGGTFFETEGALARLHSAAKIDPVCLLIKYDKTCGTSWAKVALDALGRLSAFLEDVIANK